MARVTEEEVATAALHVLATRPNGEASMQVLKRRIPDHLDLSADDLRQSTTRPAESMWEQQIRNITSHYESPGNSSVRLKLEQFQLPVGDNVVFGPIDAFQGLLQRQFLEERQRQNL